MGIGLGGTPVIVTIFSEFVPSPVRGRWMLIMQSWWTLGEPALGWGFDLQEILQEDCKFLPRFATACSIRCHRRERRHAGCLPLGRTAACSSLARTSQYTHEHSVDCMLPWSPPATAGIMFEACLAWLVLGSLEMSWRWLLALSATPLLLLFLFYHWLPESPHWLVVQGRYREAEAVVLQVLLLVGTALCTSPVCRHLSC